VDEEGMRKQCLKKGEVRICKQGKYAHKQAKEAVKVDTYEAEEHRKKKWCRSD
jgi:hypothetical protein